MKKLNYTQPKHETKHSKHNATNGRVLRQIQIMLISILVHVHPKYFMHVFLNILGAKTLWLSTLIYNQMYN